MRRISEKKAFEIVQRKLLREELRRQQGPYCKARLKGCQGEWTEMHELLSRGQCGSPLDLDNIVGLCWSCHRIVTDKPRLALDLGLRRTRLVQQHTVIQYKKRSQP